MILILVYNSIMKIGIITAGGDCAGLNIVLKTLVKKASHKGWKIIGIKNAINGLVKNPPEKIELNPKTLPFFIDMVSGTFLGSNLKFGNKEILETAIKKHPNDFIVMKKNGGFVLLSKIFQKQIKKLKLDALILTGGDDSLHRIAKLCLPIKLPIIGIPKTIDNDIKSIDKSIGFDTGVQEIVHLLDNLRTTAYSHNRIMILETMGNSTGHLAMYSGVAGGVDAIIVPEFSYSKKNLMQHIKTTLKTEKRHCGLIVVSEGVKPKNSNFKTASEEIKSWLAEEEITARATIAGHIQRGGKPSTYDRILATRLTNFAIKRLEEKKANCMVSVHDDKLVAIPLSRIKTSATRKLKRTDEIVKTAISAGIYVGS